MTYIKVNDALYPAEISGKIRDTEWDGRESKTIRLVMTYAEAVALLTDNTPWSIVYQPEPYQDASDETVTPATEEYDNSAFAVAGAITDYRNGEVAVKMGKLTDLEATLEMLYGGESV